MQLKVATGQLGMGFCWLNLGRGVRRQALVLVKGSTGWAVRKWLEGRDSRVAGGEAATLGHLQDVCCDRRIREIIHSSFSYASHPFSKAGQILQFRDGKM